MSSALDNRSDEVATERSLIGIMPVIEDQITALRRHNA
jgi:hypothetical protein